MKPILATDAVISKLKYPVVCLPKVDGVRALNIGGKLVGRSGKSFKNIRNTQFFSDPRFQGFDGEMIVGRSTGDGVCTETTSALATIKGDIDTKWLIFDYVIPGVNEKDSYWVRYQAMKDKLADLYREDPLLMRRLAPMPYTVLHTEQEVLEYEGECLEQGYEGVIIRDPEGVYKFGRSTVNEGLFLRVKTFMDSEIVVTHVIEGRTNNNELRANPHGYAERSTHAENMAPNGMIGTIVGRALEDVIVAGRVIISKDQEIEVSAGKLTHDQRREMFEDQSLIIGKIVKYQFFPIGIKDKPRFPTFQTFRDNIDL